MHKKDTNLNLLLEQISHRCLPYLLENGGKIPAVVVGIVCKDGRRVSASLGRTDTTQHTATTTEHFFDLASLTKSIFTATEILKRVDVNDLYIKYVPDFHQYHFTASLRQITIAQLLSHTTGLPAVYPFYTLGGDVIHFILQNDWTIGQHCYSDINYILLGILLYRLN